MNEGVGVHRPRYRHKSYAKSDVEAGVVGDRSLSVIILRRRGLGVLVTFVQHHSNHFNNIFRDGYPQARISDLATA